MFNFTGQRRTLLETMYSVCVCVCLQCRRRVNFVNYKTTAVSSWPGVMLFTPFIIIPHLYKRLFKTHAVVRKEKQGILNKKITRNKLLMFMYSLHSLKHFAVSAITVDFKACWNLPTVLLHEGIRWLMLSREYIMQHWWEKTEVDIDNDKTNFLFSMLDYHILLKLFCKLHELQQTVSSEVYCFIWYPCPVIVNTADDVHVPRVFPLVWILTFASFNKARSFTKVVYLIYWKSRSAAACCREPEQLH